jgi:hypothetical protein
MVKKIALILFLLLPFSGCEQPVKYVPVAPPPAEVPVANLPKQLHQRNWTDSRGSGSCVIASTIYVMRHQGAFDLADQWRRRYAGGQTAKSITDYYTRERLPFACTLDGDPAFLVWATKTRRAAIVWWKPSHCCAFVGISVIDGKEYAIIQDNNRPGTFEKTPLDEFIRKWRGYGGFACTLLLAPPQSPVPWPTSVPEGYFK